MICHDRTGIRWAWTWLWPVANFQSLVETGSVVADHAPISTTSVRVATTTQRSVPVLLLLQLVQLAILRTLGAQSATLRGQERRVGLTPPTSAWLPGTRGSPSSRTTPRTRRSRAWGRPT